MHPIHSGFANDIQQLNAATTPLSAIFDSASSRLRNYAGPIHVAVVGENLDMHNRHLARIDERPSLHGRIHAGAAGFINLAYMAHSRASGGLLFDINAYQKPFWDGVIDRLKHSADGSRFKKSLYSLGRDTLIKAEREMPSLSDHFQKACNAFDGNIFKMNPRRHLHVWIEQESVSSPDGAWMDDPRLYSHIHRLAKADAIGAITLDVTSSSACDQVAQYLEDRDEKVGLLYTSNILNFMQPVIRKTDFIGRDVSDDMQQRAKENLFAWLDEDSHVIECDNLTRNTPLLIGVGSYRPRDLAL